MEKKTSTLRFLFCLSPVVLAAAGAQAQDMVVMRDGTVVQAKVTKVGHDEVEYKKWNNQDGPLYTVKVADLLAINYQNGEKDTFTQTAVSSASQAATADNTPKEVAPVPSPQNAALIAMYNDQEVAVKGKKPSDKKTQCAFPIFGISKNSVMQDSNLRLIISHCAAGGGYAVWAENLSDNNIYIDLANSFKINNTGNSKPYFTNKTYTTNSSSSSGGGINLGAVAGAVGIGGVVGTLSNGISVGGNGSKGTSVTEQEERIMVIPPHGKRMLPLEKKANKKSVDDVPEYFSPSVMPYPEIKKYEYQNLYTEDNSPSVFRRIVTYSMTPDFNSYTRLNVGIYLKGLLGDGGIWNLSPIYIDKKTIQCTNWTTLIISPSRYVNKKYENLDKKMTIGGGADSVLNK